MKLLYFIVCVGMVTAQSCPYAHQLHERSGPVTTKTVSTTTTYYGDEMEPHRIRSTPYPLNPSEIRLIQETWDIAKKKSSIAPKIFIKYFKVKPESQSMFPAFARVPLKDLPNNKDFLLQAYTCVTSLNNYIKSLGQESAGYQYALDLKIPLTPDDLKTLNEIIFSVLEEELGTSFTQESRAVWQKAMRTCDAAVRKSSLLSRSANSPFTERQRSLLLTSWERAQKNGNIAPATFIKYFEIKPEAQKLFPVFANVPLRDLPKNYAFLAAVNTCFSNVHYLIEKAGRNPRDCPVFSKVVAKYDAQDVKRFADILIDNLRSELGSRFTEEIEESWNVAIKEIAKMVSKPENPRRRFL